MSNENFDQMKFEGGNTYLDKFSDQNGQLAEFGYEPYELAIFWISKTSKQQKFIIL